MKVKYKAKAYTFWGEWDVSREFLEQIYQVRTLLFSEAWQGAQYGNTPFQNCIDLTKRGFRVWCTKEDWEKFKKACLLLGIEFEEELDDLDLW